MKKIHKRTVAAGIAALGVAAGAAGVARYRQNERQEQLQIAEEAEEQARKEAEEAEEQARKEAEEEEEQARKEAEQAEERARQEAAEAAKRAEEEARRKRIEELKAEAEKISEKLNTAGTEEKVLTNAKQAAQTAKEVKTEIAEFREKHKQEEKRLLNRSLKILVQTETLADTLIEIASIDEMLAGIYHEKQDTVAISTAKNDKIFQDVQNAIWKLPKKYPKKQEYYEQAIARISEEWDYVNDEWNYETGTLKVSVEPKETSDTKYWVCHIQTFSTAQLCSALCGGTYGNPRVPASEETASHNGVIGINGSGFSYSTGEPAPGKSMIKGGKIYNDVYSNGNIMCVTQDGGMFTAAAGMTTEDMLNRGVKDTYCFGPTLVEDGKPYVITSAFQQTYRYQRTAVGMVTPGNYYIVAVQGSGAGGSQGMTYEELQEVFLELGCQYAYNLDGGGSTTLVFKGRVLNLLTDGKERPCADILYFIDAGDGQEGDEIVIHEDEAMIHPPKGE